LCRMTQPRGWWSCQSEFWRKSVHQPPLAHEVHCAPLTLVLALLPTRACSLNRMVHTYWLLRLKPKANACGPRRYTLRCTVALTNPRTPPALPALSLSSLPCVSRNQEPATKIIGSNGYCTDIAVVTADGLSAQRWAQNCVYITPKENVSVCLWKHRRRMCLCVGRVRLGLFH
jgi:hypothetical protein